MTAPSAVPLPGLQIDETYVRNVLRTVMDPEIGMNIVALGLVYRVEVTAGSVVVDMTMTSPACPMGDMILDDVDAALERALPSGLFPEINLVWEPPWSPAMMDEEARQHFGWTPEA
ncbi:MAG: metal-sulfur cluster assembly factor [Zoogloea sp.]|uniref:metal-sulfur cluster assembly factor n=1 Tax=Zoogloea sp. TaxID=49181 RepID=UPI0026174695|nr:metal-sulfur cluster assembly factor [Zoogloea sp.]MDD3329351.1 metal-sulfur cluster assembly factor [Zoogloea sp.]